jgi:hypothetical protein
VAAQADGLKGCKGKASSTIPDNGKYYLTSFGFYPSDDGIMSCGEYTKHGSWYYAASRQRYGCGARIRIEANAKCVVAETDDYGPDVCVEKAAGIPIIDASPLVSKHLFGTKSAGYVDKYVVYVTPVSETTPLGPCEGTGSNPPPAGTGECKYGTTGDHYDVCDGVPLETWRCVDSPQAGGKVSQVCRDADHDGDAHWLNYNLDPSDCAACCGAKVPGCAQ